VHPLTLGHGCATLTPSIESPEKLQKAWLGANRISIQQPKQQPH